MTTANNPIDIGPEQISPYKENIETYLDKFTLGYEDKSLTDLMRQVDFNEKFIYGEPERQTYIALREGLQIFDAVTEMVSEKIGLKQRSYDLIGKSTEERNAELKPLRETVHNFATYACSEYITHRLNVVLKDAENLQETDEHIKYLKVNPEMRSEDVKHQLLIPIFKLLVGAEDKGHSAFNSSYEFPRFVRDTFEQYALLSQEIGPKLQDSGKHLQGYTWNLMEGFVELDGYKAITTPRIMISEKKERVIVEPNDVVGNKAAKRNLARFADRVALFDVEKQLNPIKIYGGLPWTVLFDGIPGTGKTSLMQMWTYLASLRAEQRGIPFVEFSIDGSVKQKYYGDTGQEVIARTSLADNPLIIGGGFMDDIDMLVSRREDAQGADNDIQNILMQYLSGKGSLAIARGNFINFAASNDPAGVDGALRNRFQYRQEIEGPVSQHDFADIMVIFSKKLIDQNLLQIDLGYTPFQTQDMRAADGTWTGDDVSAYMADEFAKYKNKDLLEFGGFMKSLKDKNNLISGRSAKAIDESVRVRISDFDIDDDWFTNPSIFFEQPWETRLGMLKELYNPVTPDVLFQEAQRYFDSERRFTEAAAERDAERAAERLIAQAKGQTIAMRKLKDE